MYCVCGGGGGGGGSEYCVGVGGCLLLFLVRRPKEAVAALKKRFSGAGKNFHIVNLTLTVLETCVKNCGHRFHVKIAQKDFLSELVKTINPKVCHGVCQCVATYLLL